MEHTAVAKTVPGSSCIPLERLGYFPPFFRLATPPGHQVKSIPKENLVCCIGSRFRGIVALLPWKVTHYERENTAEDENASGTS